MPKPNGLPVRPDEVIVIDPDRPWMVHLMGATLEPREARQLGEALLGFAARLDPDRRQHVLFVGGPAHGRVEAFPHRQAVLRVATVAPLKARPVPEGDLLFRPGTDGFREHIYYPMRDLVYNRERFPIEVYQHESLRADPWDDERDATDLMRARWVYEEDLARADSLVRSWRGRAHDADVRAEASEASLAETRERLESAEAYVEHLKAQREDLEARLFGA